MLVIKQDIAMDPCRICLKTEDTKAMDATVYSLFADCLGLKLDCNEVVNLCWGCRSKLLEFDEFKKLAQDNSAFFLTQIKCEVDLPELMIKSTDDLKESLAIALPIVKHEDDCLEDQDNDDYSYYGSIADVNQERTQSDIIDKKLVSARKKRGKYKKKPKGKLEPFDTPDNALRCPNCPQFFNTSSQIYRHMRVHEIEAGETKHSLFGVISL